MVHFGSVAEEQEHSINQNPIIVPRKLSEFNGL